VHVSKKAHSKSLLQKRLRKKRLEGDDYKEVYLGDVSISATEKEPVFVTIPEEEL